MVLNKSLFQGGKLQAGKVCRPNAKINEYCKDGCEVTVILQRKIELDEGGAPTQSTWSLEAFGHSDQAKNRYFSN